MKTTTTKALLVFMLVAVVSSGASCPSTLFTTESQVREACSVGFTDAEIDALIVLARDARDDGASKDEFLEDAFSSCDGNSNSTSCKACATLLVDYLWGS